MPRAGPEPEAGVGAGNVRPIQESNRLLIANPHIADWWIWERMQVFKKYFLGKDVANATWHWDRAEWQSRSTLHLHGCSSWECEGEERVTELARTTGYLASCVGSDSLLSTSNHRLHQPSHKFRPAKRLVPQAGRSWPETCALSIGTMSGNAKGGRSTSSTRACVTPDTEGTAL
ncbi:unnamed protein product [Ectocarpus fasciculatus]